MYKVDIINRGVVTTINYPSSKTDDPHLGSIPYQSTLSQADTLTFTVKTTNPGYGKIYPLTTYVKVTNLKDNTILFVGRVWDVPTKMDNDGQIYMEVTCEGAMNYLNDTKLRGSTYYGKTAVELVTKILSSHNSKVDSHRQIFPGSIFSKNDLYHTCAYKSTLAELLGCVETYGGNMRVRETNSRLYLDWLDSYETNAANVTLGENMKDMIISHDISNVSSRVIPLGANNITIESVNGGKDYIDAPLTIAAYGVIERTAEYHDIEEPAELKAQCLKDLSKYTQEDYVLSSSALDLSYLTGLDANRFKIGTKLRINNPYFKIVDVFNITSIGFDLNTPYNPTIVMENKPHTLSGSIQDVRNNILQNNGVYNNVQIGSSFGIRAVRNDGKVITTLNATDGLTIQNQNQRVFYVNTEGKLIAIDIQAIGGKFENIIVDDGVFTDIQVDNFDLDTGTISDAEIDNCEISDAEIDNCEISDAEIDDCTIRRARIEGATISGDVKVEDDLRIDDYLRVSGDAEFKGEVEFHTSDIFINGITLKSYIKNIIEDFCDENNWDYE